MTMWVSNRTEAAQNQLLIVVSNKFVRLMAGAINNILPIINRGLASLGRQEDHADSTSEVSGPSRQVDLSDVRILAHVAVLPHAVNKKARSWC